MGKGKYEEAQQHPTRIGGMFGSGNTTTNKKYGTGSRSTGSGTESGLGYKTYWSSGS
jgi:hypothetical protein